MNRTKAKPKTAVELATTAAGLIEQLRDQLQFIAAVDPDPDLEQILRSADRWASDYQASGVGNVPERINGRCVWCGDPMEVPAREQGGGRTKRFCSSAHRIAHHRWKTDPYAPSPPPGSTLDRSAKARH